VWGRQAILVTTLVVTMMALGPSQLAFRAITAGGLQDVCSPLVEDDLNPSVSKGIHASTSGGLDPLARQLGGIAWHTEAAPPSVDAYGASGPRPPPSLFHS
jgi:hypothetical protein